MWIGCTVNESHLRQMVSHGTCNFGHSSARSWKYGFWGVHLFSRTWLRDDAYGYNVNGVKRSPNLSPAAQHYLQRLGLSACEAQAGASVEDLFHHVLTTLHDPAYREINAGALRMEWPRIPLPGWPNGDADDAAEITRRIGGAGPRTGPTARSRSIGPGRYARRIAPGYRSYCRALNSR